MDFTASIFMKFTLLNGIRLPTEFYINPSVLWKIQVENVTPLSKEHGGHWADHFH